VLGGFIGLYYVFHLEQVPETGRWRFMNIGPSTEAMLGDAVREEIHRTAGPMLLPDNHVITLHVRRVVSRILTASNLGTIKGEKKPGDSIFSGMFHTGDADFGGSGAPSEAVGPQKEWEVLVVNDKRTVNAMCAPGVVVVYTGILPVCHDDQGLAAVLAHEVGHVVARHSAERLSSQLVWTAVSIVLQVIGIDWFFANNATTYLLELPNSRTQELEADMIGLRLMSRACYDPGAAPGMFERLGKLEASMGRGGPEFMQTHPSSSNRAKILEKALPEAYFILEDNPECGQVRRQLEAFRETAQATRVDEFGTVHRI